MHIDLIEESAFSRQVIEQDSKANALATAIIEAADDSIPCICSIAAGFSAATASKAVAILDDTTEIWRGYITNEGFFAFNPPIKGTAGKNLSATLEASGAAQTTGYISIVGCHVGG